MLCIMAMVLPAQNSYNEKIMRAFSDSLKEISSSYMAYYRLWDDPNVPAPKWVKPNPNYYKLYVPPTYYLASIQDVFQVYLNNFAGQVLSFAVQHSTS